MRAPPASGCGPSPAPPAPNAESGSAATRRGRKRKATLPPAPERRHRSAPMPAEERPIRPAARGPSRRRAMRFAPRRRLAQAARSAAVRPGREQTTFYTLERTKFAGFGKKAYLCHRFRSEALRFAKVSAPMRHNGATGCSAVRLAHLLWEQGVEGSNPFTPTRERGTSQVPLFLFLYHRPRFAWPRSPTPGARPPLPPPQRPSAR